VSGKVASEAADWPRARPNFDIRSHNWRHIGRQDSIVRRSHGGNVARRQRGGIMDKVERSFAAATAAGFIVLVIGVVLLALL